MGCITVRCNRIGDGIKVSTDNLNNNISIDCNVINKKLDVKCKVINNRLNVTSSLVCGVNKKYYVKLSKQYLFLTKENNNTEYLDIISNVKWDVI